MITFLEGMLVEKLPTCAVLNVGGVGYEVFIPLSTYERLPRQGENCRLLVYDHVREDQHLLFGFFSSVEREVFTRLLNVGGIGPKLALSALSCLSAGQIVASVAAGNIDVLSSISGIGRKKAERMVVELREQFMEMAAPESGGGPLKQDVSDGKFRDAVQALVSLGYKAGEAHKKVSEACAGSEADMSVEAIVRRALNR